MAHLRGMKEICNYMRRSESTVLMFIFQMALPAKKISGGIWESDSDMIDAWRRDRLMSTDEVEKPVVKRTQKVEKKRRF